MFCLVSNSSIPLTHAGEVVQCLEEYIVVIREKIQKQNDQFVSQAAESICCNALITSFNSEFDRSLKDLRKVNTVYKAKTSLFNHPLYVHPQMIPLSYPRQHSAFYFGTKDVSTKPLKTPGERRLILDCILVFPFHNTTCLKHVFKMVNSFFWNIGYFLL